MTNQTHFLEQFRSKTKPDGVIINGPIQPIKDLESCLKRTKLTSDLYTVCVWVIKLKKA